MINLFMNFHECWVWWMIFYRGRKLRRIWLVWLNLVTLIHLMEIVHTGFVLLGIDRFFWILQYFCKYGYNSCDFLLILKINKNFLRVLNFLTIFLFYHPIVAFAKMAKNEKNQNFFTKTQKKTGHNCQKNRANFGFKIKSEIFRTEKFLASIVNTHIFNSLGTCKTTKYKKLTDLGNFFLNEFWHKKYEL